MISGWGLSHVGRDGSLCNQVIVVPLNTLGLRFKEGFGLNVPYQFGHAVIDGPDRAADAAFRDAFSEAFRAEIDIAMLVVFAHWTHAHGPSPFAHRVKTFNLDSVQNIPMQWHIASGKIEKITVITAA